MIEELTKAVSLAKNLLEIQSRIKDAQFKSLLADLQVALAEARVRVAALEEENIELRREARKASEREDLRKNVEFQDGVYYLKTPIEGRPIGPYCPACLDSRKTFQVLREMPRDFQAFGKYECPTCQSHFGRTYFGDEGVDF